MLFNECRVVIKHVIKVHIICERSVNIYKIVVKNQIHNPSCRMVVHAFILALFLHWFRYFYTHQEYNIK